MYALIKLCLADEPDAWADLWQTFDHIAAQPVRSLIVRAGFDLTEADEVAQELYLALHMNGNVRLRSFRGKSQPELESWLVHLAVNFTRDWIEKTWRARKRTRRYIQGIPTPGRSAATEPEVDTLLDDLEKVLSHEESNQLRQLAGLGGEREKPVSERTARRRRKHLERKVREHLGLPDHRKPRHAKDKRKKS